MTDPLGKSFAAQAAMLDRRISEQLCWPSPDAGFALYAFHELSLQFPTEQRYDLKIPNVQARSQTPELATAAYFWLVTRKKRLRSTKRGGRTRFHV